MGTLSGGALGGYSDSDGTVWLWKGDHSSPPQVYSQHVPPPDLLKHWACPATLWSLPDECSCTRGSERHAALELLECLLGRFVSGNQMDGCQVVWLHHGEPTPISPVVSACTTLGRERSACPSCRFAGNTPGGDFLIGPPSSWWPHPAELISTGGGCAAEIWGTQSVPSPKAIVWDQDKVHGPFCGLG